MKVVRGRLKDRRGVELAEVNEEMFFSEISSTKGANWLVELTAEQSFRTEARTLSLPPPDISAQRIRQVARNRLEQAHLMDIMTSVSRVAVAGEGLLGYSSRTMWLVSVSFLVCVVGIANAMLMSVTDRFREIATMKCLGATDGFIMINFVLESCLQGTAGGVIGAILGLLLGAMRSWVTYGWIAMENLPISQLLSMGGISIVVGVVLSALAAVYPAWVAARLAPMEAMRIE
jgi:cell division protein FtsX